VHDELKIHRCSLLKKNMFSKQIFLSIFLYAKCKEQLTFADE